MRRIATLLLLLLLPLALPAQERPDEYDVKAVYLYKIGLFVRWPESAFSDSTSPLVISVIGKDPFGAKLDRALVGKSLFGRSLEVRRHDSIDDLDTCHILFVADQDRHQTRAALSRFKDQATLIVGESDDFIKAGGDLQFLVRDDRVRFKVSDRRARQAGLDVSAKLMQLSE